VQKKNEREKKRNTDSDVRFGVNISRTAEEVFLLFTDVLGIDGTKEKGF
jgi:hypothetical protein